MKVTKNSLKGKTGNTANNITATYSNSSTTNSADCTNISEFGSDCGGVLDMDTSGSSGESFTLYKSDFEDNSGESNKSTGGSGSSRSVTLQGRGDGYGNTELRQEMLKNTPRILKKPAPVNYPSSLPLISVRNPPKYQFDTYSDFPAHYNNVATTTPTGNGVSTADSLRVCVPEKVHDTHSNFSNSIVRNDTMTVNPGPSTSFTISIPSTSKTPATTMYLPFTGRKESLKSHELQSTKFNFVRYPDTVEEIAARKARVAAALNDQDSEKKNVKYFADKNIECYLEKRGYLQPYLRVPKVITRGIFASIISLENAISNSVSFGPQYEAHEIIGEIERFWQFYLRLKAVNRELSLELKPVLIPMLLYFYLECFISGLVPVALRLYVEFSKKFVTEDSTQESYDILFEVARITSPDAFDENELLQAFRRQEYRFILSLPTFQKLKKFVVSSSCPLMLHLFSSRFTIQMKDSAVVAETFVEHPCLEPQRKRILSGSKASEVIKRLREAVHSDLPSLSLYLTNGSPICGAVSPAGSMIAYGMAGGSGIQLGFTSNKSLETFKADRPYEGEEISELGMMNTLIAHSGSVYDLQFHPRTKRLFSVGQDCTMRVWDLNKLSCRAVYRGHSLPIGAIDISESGIMLATGSIDTTARIWLPERTNYVRLLAGHYLDVTSVKFHPNEAYIATGSQDTSARLWSISDGNIVRVFTGFHGTITNLAFHETGKYLIAGGSDPFIRVYDIGEGEILAELPCPPNCTSIALNLHTLAASFEFNKVRLWNLQQVLNGSSDSSAQSPHPAKITSISNSLFKLQFSNPRHIIGLGEEYVRVKREQPMKSTKKESEIMNAQEKADQLSENYVKDSLLAFIQDSPENRLESYSGGGSDEEDAFNSIR